MLSKIIIKNFKCFKEETVFDFKKTNYKFLEKNVKGKLLKGLLFVGDNASGKTTAIEPIVLLLELLFKDKEVNLPIFHCLFSDERNTSLQYDFEIDGHEIQYSFSFRQKKILEEELILDNVQIIERIGDNAKLIMGNEKSIYAIDSSILFIKRLYFSTKFEGNETLKKWIDFLKESVWINAYSRRIVTFNEESLLYKDYFEKYGEEKINHFLRDNGFNYTIHYVNEIENNGVSFKNTGDGEKMVFFQREGIEIPIPLFLESTGNMTLINILPSIIHSVEKGGLLIIDEFSSGFHNKLEELIIRYIMTYSNNTQVMLVSHSTNLLSNSLLRPDQIYAVEMKGEKGSVLSRFSDEQPRVAQNLEKMYLSGIFGGIPEYEDKQE